MTKQGSVTDPDGRTVVMDARTYAHLRRRRPTILDSLDAVMQAVERPDHRDTDEIGGREHFYILNPLRPGRWLRVVVDFNEDPGWIVTVLVQTNDPREADR